MATFNAKQKENDEQWKMEKKTFLYHMRNLINRENVIQQTNRNTNRKSSNDKTERKVYFIKSVLCAASLLVGMKQKAKIKGKERFIISICAFSNRIFGLVSC